MFELSDKSDAFNLGDLTELASVEEWDGDTQDEINIAISRFSQLLKFASI